MNLLVGQAGQVRRPLSDWQTNPVPVRITGQDTPHAS